MSNNHGLDISMDPFSSRGLDDTESNTNFLKMERSNQRRVITGTRDGFTGGGGGVTTKPRLN
jgi:hypothetical protein